MLNKIRINIITDNHYLFLGIKNLLPGLFGGSVINLHQVVLSYLESIRCGDLDIYCIDVNTANESILKLTTSNYKVFYLVSDINYGFFDSGSRINRRASLRDF